MNNNQDLFTFDKCYERPNIMTEASFNMTLMNSYNKYLAPSVRDCEIKALRNNSEFFLINDVSSIGTNNYTNCYIPKPDYSSSSSVIGDNSIIAKALNLFNATFSPYTIQTENRDSCSNILYNNGTNSPNKCFNYLLDNKVYAPKKYYAYYKKPIINSINRDIVISNPQIYKDKIVELKNYEELLKIDQVNFSENGNGNLANAFKNFICSPTILNDRALDAQIFILKGKYENLFAELDRISRDISSINYLNSFDDETIIALNVRIKDRNNELTTLLGFGGANNGRLQDTTLLTQFKIVENSILLLIIITALFLYNKMKKIK